jgi:predicted HTH domain antitoxin
MVEVEKSTVVTVRLSKQNLRRIEAVRTLENVDRSTLFKEFIEDGLRDRVLQLYKKGKLTQRRAAEIMGVTLREFLELLEKECIPINWDSQSIKRYMKEKYGE